MINNNAVEELEINYPPITSKILGGTSFKTKSIGDFFVSAFQDDGAIRLTIARKDCQPFNLNFLISFLLVLLWTRCCLRDDRSNQINNTIKLSKTNAI